MGQAIRKLEFFESDVAGDSAAPEATELKVPTEIGSDGAIEGLLHTENLEKPDLKLTRFETERLLERRIAPRVPISGKLILHDERGFIAGKGFGVNISASGIAVKAQNIAFIPGDTVTVEYIGCSQLPAFSAKCQVVRTQPEEGFSARQTLGLRIVKMSRLAIKAVEDYVVRVHGNGSPGQALLK